MLTVLASGRSCEVAVGESVTFGRGGLDDGVELTLSSDERLHRTAGRVVVHDHGWELVNTGRWLHLLASDLDGSGRDDLAPGVSRLIPWSRVLVEIPLGHSTLSFEVVSPRDSGADERVMEGHGTIEPFRVDRTAGYFRALVALCEPRLIEPTSVEIPSDAQVAVRLNGSGTESRHLTAKAIERRFDYVRRILGLKVFEDGLSGVGAERSDARQSLVDIALATGTVSRRDLDAIAPCSGPVRDV